MGVTQKLNRISVAIDRTIEGFFRRLGHLVYRNTNKFLVIPLLVAALCAVGVINTEEAFDPEKLYTPDDSPSFDAKAKVEASFSFPAREGYVYAVRRPGVTDLLSTQSVLDWYDTWNALQTVKALGDGPDTAETLATVCVLKAGACRASSVLAVWSYNRTLIASRTDAQIKQDFTGQNGIAIEQDGAPLSLDRVVNLNAAGEATSFKLVLVLKADVEDLAGMQSDDPQTLAWEEDAYDMIRTYKNATQIDVYAWFLSVQNAESKAAVDRDVTLLTLGFNLLAVYAALVLTRRDPFYIHSHGSVAVVSFCISGLAVFATFGVGTLMGITFSTAVKVLSVLMLGLGLDDTFVIHAAFMDPDIQRLPGEERCAEALARAGTSITITSMTDFFAFLAGSYTTIPAIRAFCQFAAIGVLFDFALQITAFMSVLVLSSQREAANRRDWLCCYVAPTTATGCTDKSPHDPDKPEMLTVFMRDYYAPALLSKKGKAVVSVTAVALLAFSIWAMLQVKVDFDLESFVPADSHLIDTFDIRNEYWGSMELPQAFYTFGADYKSEVAQTELAGLTASVAAAPFLVPQGCDSWWTPFMVYAATKVPSVVAASTSDPAFQVVNTASFDATLAEWLGTADGLKYTAYLRPVGISATNPLQASKIPCVARGAEESTEYRIDQMEAARDIADKYPTIDATAYTYTFIFSDGFVVVKEIILTNIGLAILAVLFLTMALLGNFLGACMVGLMVAMIDAEVLMTWYLFGDTWNYVTGINLVLGIGLSVDPLAHVTHSFLRTSGTGDERARHALAHIGRSVLNGVISTSLVVVPLAMSSSYIFQVFGKCILSIMLFSAWHGLAVLPVLLSFVQPASYVDLRGKLGEVGGDTARGDLSTVFPEPESPGTAGTDPTRITAF